MKSEKKVKSKKAKVKRARNIFYNIMWVLLFTLTICKAQDKPEVGIDEKLGNYIPADAVFIDEHGQSVNLKSLVDKPTILSLVYYRCPGICSPLLTGVAEVVDRVDVEAGKDFNVITISFDPREDYLTASDKKKNYLTTMKKKIPDNSWQFLTGDSLNIAKITDAVGWRYQKQGNDFMHGSGIMVLSPEGKIVRYLFGISYLPFDMKMALIEASEGRTGPTISKLVKLCYSYDPEGRRYVFNFTRVAGAGILLMLIVLFVVLSLKKKKVNPNLSGGKV